MPLLSATKPTGKCPDDGPIPLATLRGDLQFRQTGSSPPLTPVRFPPRTAAITGRDPRRSRGPLPQRTTCDSGQTIQSMHAAFKSVSGRHLAAAAAKATRVISTTPATCKDPWLLPNTPEHLASTETSTSPDFLPPPAPIKRRDEPVETMRARLVYQSRKRGTLESDLLLSTFAKEHLDKMDEKDLKEYDRLLDEPDWDIYYWSTGKRMPPTRWANSAVLEKLRAHAKNEGKVVRRMPPL